MCILKLFCVMVEYTKSSIYLQGSSMAAGHSESCLGA